MISRTVGSISFLIPGLMGMISAVGCSSSPGEDDFTTDSRIQNGALQTIAPVEETQPIYSYADAIREVIYVEAPMDSDGDGRLDRIAMDVMRPKETQTAGLKVPIVMEASPYYSDAPEGATLDGTKENASRMIPGRTVPRGFGRWYDDFFVPRGYAVIEVEMQGTARSKGCPTTGGVEDTISIKASIDWLNGRAKAYRADGSEVVATWSTGAVGMLGVSYNGTLPTAVAATGVEGLKTVVPIAAISSWYDYTRDQGIGYANGWDDRYPEWLANYVVSTAQTQTCASRISRLGDNAGDGHFDHTSFWDERNYRKDAANIRASVFVVHGLEDWNVKTHHFGRLWKLLEERNVPRKIWLHRNAHVDPVSIRKDVWQKTMHHWMDHFLYGIQNGIMEQPQATIQRPDGSWEDRAAWPEPGTREVSLHLGPAGGGLTGTLRTTPVTTTATQSFNSSSSATEATMVGKPEEVRAGRLAYGSAILTSPVRFGGTPRFHAKAKFSTTSSPLTAFLVDYGESATAAPLDFSYGELMAMPCDMENLLNNTGCAAPQKEMLVVTSAKIVTKGTIDVKNRLSIVEPTPITPGQTYDVEWELHPKDYIFPTGHRIGVVIAANDYQYVTVDSAAGNVQVSLQGSHLILPVASGTVPRSAKGD